MYARSGAVWQVGRARPRPDRLDRLSHPARGPGRARAAPRSFRKRFPEPRLESNGDGPTTAFQLTEIGLAYPDAARELPLGQAAQPSEDGQVVRGQLAGDGKHFSPAA